MQRALWLLPLLLAGPGCDGAPGKPDPANRPVPLEQVLDFDKLFAIRCAGCHGANGTLGPAPPLNDPLFLQIVSGADVDRAIREGRRTASGARTPMPAFGPEHGGPLSAAQVKVLAEGIRKKWSGAPQSQPESPAYALEPGKGDTALGRLVFQRACAGCHGSDGRGGPELAGAVNNPDYLALTSDQVLRRLIITGRPDLGMPNFAGKAGRAPDFQPLTSADVNDLVALLRTWREGKSGGPP